MTERAPDSIPDGPQEGLSGQQRPLAGQDALRAAHVLKAAQERAESLLNTESQQKEGSIIIMGPTRSGKSSFAKWEMFEHFHSHIIVNRFDMPFASILKPDQDALQQPAPEQPRRYRLRSKYRGTKDVLRLIYDTQTRKIIDDPEHTEHNQRVRDEIDQVKAARAAARADPDGLADFITWSPDKETLAELPQLPFAELDTDLPLIINVQSPKGPSGKSGRMWVDQAGSMIGEKLPPDDENLPGSDEPAQSP